MSDRNTMLGANIVNLSVCYQYLPARINRVLERLGLSMSQLSILTRFARMPDDYLETVTHLAQAMEMNQPYLYWMQHFLSSICKNSASFLV